MRIKGIFATILSAILFGLTPLLTTMIYDYGATSMTVVFFRSLFVLPILAMIMYNQKISFQISRYDLKNVVLIAIFGSGLTTILLFSSYNYIDIGCATTLHFLYPVFVSLLCFFIYKQKISKHKQVALGLALIGALCFFDLSANAKPIGLFMAIASALTYAFYMVQLEKTRLAHENAYKVSFYLAVFITLETLACSIIFPIHFVMPWKAYGLFIVLAIMSSFLAVVLLQKGIQYLGSSTASLFCLFEPITSVFCGWLVLGEALTLSKILGCILILIALVIMSRKNKFEE